MFVKTRIFFVRNNWGRKVNLYLHTCVCMWVCVRSGMYKSLNLFVIQANCWRVSIFKCV